MIPAVLYNNKVYPASMKQSLHIVDFLQSLPQRERDMLFVFEILTSARYAKYPSELTTQTNIEDLAKIEPILEQYGWQSLLDNPEYVEGVSPDGVNFYTVHNK